MQGIGAHEVFIETSDHETTITALDDDHVTLVPLDCAGQVDACLEDLKARILAAEGKFQRGEGYLRKGKWELAHDAFGEAVAAQLKSA